MTLHHGDCLEIMAGMDPESVDAIVTDPPYGLEFMGKEWDKLWTTAEPGPNAKFTAGNRDPRFHRTSSPVAGLPSYRAGAQAQQFHARWAEAAYRVAKPSAYLLAFGGTRTVHRMTVALEDAGWIIRDMLVWGYASGFPKSKASLKPAWEPIVMARKPGPLRMLAIDECRIPSAEDQSRPPSLVRDTPTGMGKGLEMGGAGSPLGRWPANIVLTDPIFDGGVEGVVGGGEQHSQQTRTDPDARVGESMFGLHERGRDYLGDTGTYSRFFLVPKSSRSDREPVLGGLPLVKAGAISGAETRPDRPTNHPMRQNSHPTVKPTDLMRHLVRLVTPTGGIVLDPFLGSGTTALAAEMEGFEWVGIEREAEYVAIAEARLNGTQRGLGLGA
jgi:DNA modification methylase